MRRGEHGFPVHPERSPCRSRYAAEWQILPGLWGAGNPFCAVLLIVQMNCTVRAHCVNPLFPILGTGGSCH